jgi:hypothetical protein
MAATITIHYLRFTITRKHGKEIIDCEIAEEAEILGARVHPLQKVR